MKTIAKKMELGGLAVQVPFTVFENLSEASASAGSEAQLVKKLNDGALPRFTAQRLVTEAVNRLTGVAFITKTSKNPATGVVKQIRDKKKDSDALYIARALKAKPISAAAVEAELAKSNGALTVSLGERAVKAPKVGKAVLADAADFLAGTKSLEKLNARFAQLGLASFAFDANATKEANIQALALRLVEYLQATKL